MFHSAGFLSVSNFYLKGIKIGIVQLSRVDIIKTKEYNFSNFKMIQIKKIIYNFSIIMYHNAEQVFFIFIRLNNFENILLVKIILIFQPHWWDYSFFKTLVS